MIDTDPVRKAGISSTDDEHAAALERAASIRAWLAARGWREPVTADSATARTYSTGLTYRTMPQYRPRPALFGGAGIAV